MAMGNSNSKRKRDDEDVVYLGDTPEKKPVRQSTRDADDRKPRTDTRAVEERKPRINTQDLNEPKPRAAIGPPSRAVIAYNPRADADDGPMVISEHEFEASVANRRRRQSSTPPLPTPSSFRRPSHPSHEISDVEWFESLSPSSPSRPSRPPRGISELKRGASPTPLRSRARDMIENEQPISSPSRSSRPSRDVSEVKPSVAQDTSSLRRSSRPSLEIIDLAGSVSPPLRPPSPARHTGIDWDPLTTGESVEQEQIFGVLATPPGPPSKDGPATRNANGAFDHPTPQGGWMDQDEFEQWISSLHWGKSDFKALTPFFNRIPFVQAQDLIGKDLRSADRGIPINENMIKFSAVGVAHPFAADCRRWLRRSQPDTTTCLGSRAPSARSVVAWAACSRSEDSSAALPVVRTTLRAARTTSNTSVPRPSSPPPRLRTGSSPALRPIRPAPSRSLDWRPEPRAGRLGHQTSVHHEDPGVECSSCHQALSTTFLLCARARSRLTYLASSTTSLQAI